MAAFGPTTPALPAVTKFVLTVADLAAHLHGITYRTGWTLSVYEGRFEGPHLRIHATVENSYSPGDPVELDVHTFIPPMVDAAQFDAFLAWRLGRVEIHECREWLKRDGLPLFDPHAPDADQDR